jgi:hypothetical protein
MRRACARAGALGRARSNAVPSAHATPGLARALTAPLASAVAAVPSSATAAQFLAGPRARVRALHASSAAAAVTVEKGEQVGECRDGPLFAVIGKQQRNVCVVRRRSRQASDGK